MRSALVKSVYANWTVLTVKVVGKMRNAENAGGVARKTDMIAVIIIAIIATGVT